MQVVFHRAGVWDINTHHHNHELSNRCRSGWPHRKQWNRVLTLGDSSLAIMHALDFTRLWPVLGTVVDLCRSQRYSVPFLKRLSFFLRCLFFSSVAQHLLKFTSDHKFVSEDFFFKQFVKCACSTKHPNGVLPVYVGLVRPFQMRIPYSDIDSFICILLLYGQF